MESVKPTNVHYFFANDWPFKIWQTTWTVACVVFTVMTCLPTLGASGDWKPVPEIIWFVAAVLISIPLGWSCALLAAFIVLDPLYYDRGIKNGAPFVVGDRVRILVKSHRDRITYVYSTWQHNSVRVDLGEAAREEYKDIFNPTQLFREPGDDTERAVLPLQT